MFCADGWSWLVREAEGWRGSEGESVGDTQTHTLEFCHHLFISHSAFISRSNIQSTHFLIDRASNEILNLIRNYLFETTLPCDSNYDGSSNIFLGLFSWFAVLYLPPTLSQKPLYPWHQSWWLDLALHIGLSKRIELNPFNRSNRRTGQRALTRRNRRTPTYNFCYGRRLGFTDFYSLILWTNLFPSQVAGEQITINDCYNLPTAMDCLTPYC